MGLWITLGIVALAGITMLILWAAGVFHHREDIPIWEFNE